jgi:hypothetical protein
MEKSLAKSGEKLMIYGTPVEEKNGFLSEVLVTKYNQIFDRAEKAVAGSQDILERVKVTRLPLYYTMLEIARNEKTGTRGAFSTVEGNKLIQKPEIVKILHDFVYLSIKTNIFYLRERRITPQQYLDAYTKFLADPDTKWTIPI